MFDEKRIEDDSLDNNAIDNNGNDHDHCHDFTDDQLKYPHKSNDVDHYLSQNEKHLNTYHSDINITSAIVSNEQEQEDIKLNITPITLTSSKFKEEDDQASNSIMANTASESLSPSHTIDSENCLNSTDELQQMIDDEMENIDSGVYATPMSSVTATNLLRFSLISSTTAMPTTSTATPKPFEFDEDALDNL